MATWYGSVTNRIEENRMLCDEIKVGTGMTEYGWSDRHPYEVVAVKDQNHVTVRAMGHRPVPDSGFASNEWELFSDPDGAEYDMVRTKYGWYFTCTITAADLTDDPDLPYRLVVAGFDIEKIRAKGKQTKRRKANVSFGKAEYYYDYEF